MFLTSPCFLRQIRFGRVTDGPDKFWRVQQFLRLSWNFRGRKQNCYKIGMRYVFKSMMYATVNRQVKKKEALKLWYCRTSAACEEHGMKAGSFLEGLSRCNIMLDKKVLADLAIYEPRTFQALTEVSKQKLIEDGEKFDNIK